MLQIDGDLVRYLVLLFTWTEYFWEQFIAIRQVKIKKQDLNDYFTQFQHKKILATTKVPAELAHTMTEDIFNKARRYSLAKSKFGFIKDTFSIILSTLVIQFRILSLFWGYALQLNRYGGGEVLTSCIWLGLLSTASTFIELPISIYNTFVLEEEFGFNKQTSRFFIWDKIKSFVLMQVFSSMVCSIVIITIKNGGEYFFIWLWLVVFIITCVFLTIYPSLIAPLFDKFTALPEGELRTNIEALALKLKFPLTGLYVVEGSKRSSHSNAYFYGMFKVKRIVLFDTLLAKEDGTGCSNDEILAVLSHELGHWQFNHLIKNLIIMQVNLFLLFAGFSVMFKSPAVYEAFGFYNTRPVLVGLIIILQYVMLPYNSILSFFMTCMSRKFEFQADSFAVGLGKAKYLGSALVQLNKDNLGFPIYDSLYSAWHHSHPPLLERIEALKKQD